METHKVSLEEIKVDPLAHELATSEGTKPHLDYLIKAYSNDAAGLEAALQEVRDLPLEKRYTLRVFSALKWAFADFEDEYVALDLLHIPEPTRSEMTKPRTVADFVADFPHRIKTSDEAAVRPIPFPGEVDLLSRLNWANALLKSNIDLLPTLCDNPPMIAGSRYVRCGAACLHLASTAITVWPYPQKKC
jgi:hypothetical protein